MVAGGWLLMRSITIAAFRGTWSPTVRFVRWMTISPGLNWISICGGSGSSGLPIRREDLRPANGHQQFHHATTPIGWRMSVSVHCLRIESSERIHL